MGHILGGGPILNARKSRFANGALQHVQMRADRARFRDAHIDPTGEQRDANAWRVGVGLPVVPQTPHGIEIVKQLLRNLGAPS